MKSLNHIVMPTRVLPHHSMGGMQEVAWDLAKAIARKGIRVTVLTASIPGKPALFEEEGVQIAALPKTNWRNYGNGWKQKLRQAFQQQYAEDCDLLFSISAGGFGLLPFRQHLPEIPFVLQAHGTSVGEVTSKWKSRSVKGLLSSVRNMAWIAKDIAAYRRFDAIVAVGDAVDADLRSWPNRLGTYDKEINLIRNGIDTNLFKPAPEARQRIRSQLGWGNDVRIVVSSGRLHKQKGVDLALAAFARAVKRRIDLRFLILGDGPELKTLIELSSRLRLDDVVRFCGRIPRFDLPAYLCASDVMLFTTTRVEGLPLNVLEAQAVGLPIVASSHLYPRSSPSSRIVLAPPENAEAVCVALDRGLDIGISAESTLPPGFAIGDCADTYLALFERLRSSRTARTSNGI